MNRKLFKRFHKELANSLKSETGSISILIIGLFITALAVIMVVTDISVLAAAKRSLDHATEASVQSATHTLDKDAYYSGKMNRLIQIYRLANPNYYVENRIPVDCNAGLSKATEILQSWQSNGGFLKRTEILSHRIDNFECQYDTISMNTSAVVKLPFNIPFSNISKATVKSSISARNQKNMAFYLFGVRLH